MQHLQNPQKRNLFFGLLFEGGLVPETLCFTRFLQDFESKKKTTFGVPVGLFLDSPEPKTLYFTMLFDDFTRFVFELQKLRNQPRRWVKLG